MGGCEPGLRERDVSSLFQMVQEWSSSDLYLLLPVTEHSHILLMCEQYHFSYCVSECHEVTQC